jgi:hypothetical protein
VVFCVVRRGVIKGEGIGRNVIERGEKRKE